MFDLEALGLVTTHVPEIERLPKGEPVRIRFKPQQSVRIRLAKHDFVLVSGTQFLLVDEPGEDVRVNGPRCVISRGASCNAMVDSRYRAVSHKHLIVETNDENWVQFTDISSLGTALPVGVRECLPITQMPWKNISVLPSRGTRSLCAIWA
jgi:hypothetical protein